MNQYRYIQECWEVFDIISPYECDVENGDITKEQNEQAKNALVEFYHEFKNKGNKRCFVVENKEDILGIFCYINPLLKVYLALQSNNYCLAIWELMYIHPVIAFYDRYYYNILSILVRGLGLNDR